MTVSHNQNGGRCEDTHADFADVARVEVADDESNLVHHVALVEALHARAAEYANEDFVG